MANSAQIPASGRLLDGGSFFAFIKLLSMADLSFAVAVTAASIVFETVLAKLVLDESVARLRWADAFCVASGVALLAAGFGGPL